jgi:hypothetical protein
MSKMRTKIPVSKKKKRKKEKSYPCNRPWRPIVL